MAARRVPGPDQAHRIVTVPSGSDLATVAAIFGSLKCSAPTVNDERRMRLFTLSDGSIAVYRLRSYRSW